MQSKPTRIRIRVFGNRPPTSWRMLNPTPSAEFQTNGRMRRRPLGNTSMNRYEAIGLLLVGVFKRRRRHVRMSRIVITGAPGAGKTTLLLALQARGYTIVGDTARTIIQDRRRRGLSPRSDPYAFAQEALRMDIENFSSRCKSRPGLL